MRSWLLLASALCACAWACGDFWAAQAHAALPYAAIYQRATNVFAEAEFFKPAERKTNDLAFTLAPLILQEVSSGKEPRSRADWFGTLSLSNGVPGLDESRPAIYWQADTAQLKGKARGRFAYLWCYTSRPEVCPTGLPVQGIRITLNSAGQPVLWEVLADISGAELIFVSQSLEAAAAAEFGKPRPGRRYAVECSVEEAPNVVVARVIDDSPVAMGPIVYLSADTRAVSTLICRCMPAQAKQLLGTSTYDLLPCPATTAPSPLAQAAALAKEHTAFWPGDQASDNRLEHCLRLPSAF